MTAAVLELEQLTPDVLLPRIPYRMKGYDGPTSSAEMTEECRELAEARAAIQGPYQRRPGDVRTLLWRARALDIPVGVAIDHIYINMQGKAGLSAQLIAGLLRRAGIDWTCTKTPDAVQFAFFEEVWFTTAAGKIVKRKKRLGTVGFELLEAQAAGIAGTRHWQKWPIQCMWARAMARAGRELFSDVTLGFAYTPEELHDGTAAEAGPTAGDEQIDPLVVEFIEQARSEDATPDLIKSDIMVRARKARPKGQLLKEHAGGGRTLIDVLNEIWLLKVAHDEDQQTALVADQAMAAAGITVPPAPAAVDADAWKTAPIGKGFLPCSCPNAVLISGIHPRTCTRAGL